MCNWLMPANRNRSVDSGYSDVAIRSVSSLVIILHKHHARSLAFGAIPRPTVSPPPFLLRVLALAQVMSVCLKRSGAERRSDFERKPLPAGSVSVCRRARMERVSGGERQGRKEAARPRTWSRRAYIQTGVDAERFCCAGPVGRRRRRFGSSYIPA